MRHSLVLALVIGSFAVCPARAFAQGAAQLGEIVKPEEIKKPSVLTFAQLREGIRQRYHELHALQVDYRQSLRDINVAIHALPEMDYQFALKGEKRFCSQLQVINGKTSLDGAVTVAFDEKSEQVFSPGARTGSISHPSEKSTFVDVDAYAHSQSLALTDRERATVGDTPYFMPYALDTVVNDWKVLPNLGEVDGAECHVLESAYRQRIWIDPKIGFAMRYREIYQYLKEKPKQAWPVDARYSFREFEKMGESLWLPKSVDILTYVQANEPEGRWNLPGWRSSLRARKLLVNDEVSDKLFTISYPSGTSVIDDVRNRYYFVGDANEELDITVSKASNQLPATVVGRRFWLLSVNAMLILVFAAIVGYRFVKSKRPVNSTT